MIRIKSALRMTIETDFFFSSNFLVNSENHQNEHFNEKEIESKLNHIWPLCCDHSDFPCNLGICNTTFIFFSWANLDSNLLCLCNVSLSWVVKVIFQLCCFVDLFSFYFDLQSRENIASRRLNDWGFWLWTQALCHAAIDWLYSSSSLLINLVSLENVASTKSTFDPK